MHQQTRKDKDITQNTWQHALRVTYSFREKQQPVPESRID